MADIFKIRIVSPRGVESEERTGAVSLPAEAGDIEILPHHVRYAGILGTGTISYFGEGKNVPTKLVVSGGFITFADDVLTVLADSVVTADNRAVLGLSADGIAKERVRLEKLISGGGPGEPAWRRAQQELRRLDGVERL